MGVRRGVCEELEGKEKRERSLQTLYESLLGSWEQWEKQAITSNPSPYPDIGNIFLPEPFFSSLSPSLPCPPSLPLSPSPSLFPPCISNLILWGRQGRCNKERRVCVDGPLPTAGRSLPPWQMSFSILCPGRLLQPLQQHPWKMSRKVFYSSDSFTNSSQIKWCEY